MTEPAAGHGRLAALAAAVLLLGWVAHVAFTWTLLPSIAATHEGLGLPLPLTTRLHAELALVLGVLLLAGSVAAVAAALRPARAPWAAPLLSVAGVLALAFVLASVLAAQRSTSGGVTDALLAARGQAGHAERGTMALLAGDLAQAEKELTAARNLGTGRGLACVSSPGYAALQLAEVRRQQGRMGEARGFYAAAMAESGGRSCIDSGSPFSVAATARARLSTLAGAPVTAPSASQAQP